VDLPRTAEVVIIGGGAIGASTAYHLTQLGVRDVLVLERDALAAGSTGRSVGGVRAQFSTEANVQIMLYSIDLFERFTEEFGLDIGFHQVGYLFLLHTQQLVDAFHRNVQMQRRLGFDVLELDPEEARRRFLPQLVTDGVLGTTWCAREGYADPTSATNGFAARAREQGATVRVGVNVTGIQMDGDRIRGVETDQGTVATNVVICCAGAWSAEVGRMAGVDLPIYGWRQQVFFTGPFDQLPEQFPLLIDYDTHFAVRREGTRLMLYRTNLEEPPSFSTHYDESWLEHLIPAATRRLPVLEHATVESGWGGLYDRSPDENAVIGEMRSPTRFLYATGFSGHGFMQSPGVGKAVAEMVVHGRSTLDLTEFSAERFTSGALVPEAIII
jgi:sarcosine oxidase, subunit beta